MIGDDLGELLLNIIGIGGLASDPAERIRGSIDSTFLDIPSWRFWQQE